MAENPYQSPLEMGAKPSRGSVGDSFWAIIAIVVLLLIWGAILLDSVIAWVDRIRWRS